MKGSRRFVEMFNIQSLGREFYVQNTAYLVPLAMLRVIFKDVT